MPMCRLEKDIMRYLTLFFSFITLNLFGQGIPKNIQVTANSDTTFWSKYHAPDIDKLDLIGIDKNIDFFRVSSSKYFLELSQNSNKVFFYVKEIWNNVQTDETFSKSFDLDTKQVKALKKLIDSLTINEIASDRYIQDWHQGFDGITYLIEHKKDNLYSFKKYWTPSSQNSFKESVAILKFITELDRIVEYQAKRKLFESEIPFYGWTYNGSTAIVKIISNTKAYQKYKLMKKRQLKQKGG